MFSHFPTTTHPVHIKAGGCTAREWVDWGHVHEGWSRFGSCFGKVRVHFWWFLWARLRPHLQLYKYTVTQVFAWVTHVIVWNCNCVSVIHLSSTAVGTVTFRLTFTEAFVSNICREKQRSAIRVKLWFRVILRGVDKETEFSEKACSIIQNLCLFWRAPPRLHPHRARLSHAPFCHFCFLSLFNLPFPSSCAAPSAVLHFLSCNQCGV